MVSLDLEVVLDMAISREISAQTFYRELAGKVSDTSTKDALTFLVAEEESHERLLRDYREGKGPTGGLGMHHAINGAVVEHFGQPVWNPAWKPEEAFLAAADAERRAHTFYRDLASAHPPGKTKDFLEKLAREEASHKEKVEYLYTNTAFPQTDGG